MESIHLLSEAHCHCNQHVSKGEIFKLKTNGLHGSYHFPCKQLRTRFAVQHHIPLCKQFHLVTKGNFLQLHTTGCRTTPFSLASSGYQGPLTLGQVLRQSMPQQLLATSSNRLQLVGNTHFPQQMVVSRQLPNSLQVCMIQSSDILPFPLQMLKKHPCRQCDKSFSSSHSLCRHNRLKHKGLRKVYTCP